MEKTDMRNYSSSFRGKGSEFFWRSGHQLAIDRYYFGIILSLGKRKNPKIFVREHLPRK